MPHGCPRPRMRWNGAIGAIARGKKVSTVCAPKSRARHALRLIGGEPPGARGVATLFTPYMRPGQDESNPVSLLQCHPKGAYPRKYGCCAACRSQSSPFIALTSNESATQTTL